MGKQLPRWLVARSFSHFDFPDGMILELSVRADGDWQLTLTDPLKMDQIINVRVGGELQLELDAPTERNPH